MATICLGCGNERRASDDGADALFCSACAARALLPPEAPCFLCGGALDDGADRRLRGLAICTACGAELSMEDPRGEAGGAPVRARRVMHDGGPPSAAACAACQRRLPRGELRMARGFRLCAACLDSDPILALALARARHRRALQDLGRRLLGEADRDDE
jgi:hypothetical protein